MAEAGATSASRSPFEGHTPGEHPTRGGTIGVRLTAGTLRSVTLIGTWPNGANALCAALSAVLGTAVPPNTGHTTRTDAGLLLRTGPEEFMLISNDVNDRITTLRQRIAADIGSVTDLSHARCRIRIQGDKCRDTLLKLFALDLREPAFPLNQARLTGHHHVPCMLHRLGPERFDLYVFSTYAFDQLSTLTDAALEYGVALQFQTESTASTVW